MGYKFEFEIKNFGPIEYGKIELRPLTLVIGPNGSGKSYIAMLIQSIFDSHTRSGENMPVYLDSIINIISNEDFAKPYLNKFPDLAKRLEEFKSKEKIPFESIEPLIETIFKALYEDRLSQELIYAFSSPLDDLIQIGKESFQIKTIMGSYSASMNYKKGDKLILREHTPVNTNLEDDQKKFIISQLDKIDKPYLSSHSNSQAMLEFMISAIMIFGLRASEFLRISCRYLPAARSGIVLVRKKILTDEYKKNPFFGNKSNQDQLSGAVSSFIYNIHNLPEKKGPLNNLAKDFERELINGEIIKSVQDERMYPDIKYRYLDQCIPLHRASSTVSELTPIILYLKYIVKRGDVLIIEEPEAHLHPGNQLILAKYLVKLIRKGVRLIITTHSDYLLQKLNNFILQGAIKSRSCKDYLLSREVGAYVFEKSESDSYTINKLEVTKHDGISDRDFSKVVESLYEETVALKENLYSKEI